MLGRKSLVLALILAIGSTAAADDEPNVRLTLAETYDIADPDVWFMEPSGLSLVAEGDGLWSVSDDTKAIYRLDLRGAVDPDRSLPMPVSGLEGVVHDPAGNRLIAVRERHNEVLVVDLATETVVQSKRLADMEGYDDVADYFPKKDENKGFEGVAIDPKTGEILVIKEAKPRLLLRLAPDLSTILEVRELDAAAGFTAESIEDRTLDVSDIAYDPLRNLYWIVSDEGGRVFLYDWESGEASGISLVVSKHGKDYRYKHVEGIALSHDGMRVYVVTDDGKQSRLFVYDVK